MAEPTLVEALIEIPAGSQNKYEFDHVRGVMRLDRVLYSPVHYPTDYGYIPQTLEEDGDPLDIMVMVTFPTLPGCLVEARVVGALEMADDKGQDWKVLGVPVRDPRFDQVLDLDHVPKHVLREIEHFFATYKDLEGKRTDVRGWRDAAEAGRVVARARQAYRPGTAL